MTSFPFPKHLENCALLRPWAKCCQRATLVNVRPGEADQTITGREHSTSPFSGERHHRLLLQMNITTENLIETKEERNRRLKRERMKAYRQTTEGKAYQKAYMRAYRQAPEFKRRENIRLKAYYQTEKGKAARNSRDQTIKYKTQQREYGLSSAGRARLKRYYLTPKSKTRRNRYRQKPESKHREKIYMGAYRQKPDVRARNSQLTKLRMTNDPVFKLVKCLRVRILNYLKGRRKSAPTAVLLGCTADYARSHIESQFQRGWSWANHGKVWHIDHIRPLASFTVMDEAEQRIAFHYTNLQPLLGVENQKKGSLYNGVCYKKSKI